MANTLKEIDKQTKKAIAWLAALYNYLKKDEEIVSKMASEGAKEQKHDIRKALRTFRWIGRAERRAARIEEKLGKELNELAKLLPPKENNELSKIRGTMAPFISMITKYFSLYQGVARKELKKLRVDISLEEKYPEKEEKVVKAEIEKVDKELKDLVKATNGLQVELRNLEKFVARLEVLV